jgi:hypothetical protein
MMSPRLAAQAKLSQQEKRGRIRITGGAQVGWVNASWPFATLAASATELSISGRLIGSYTFAPDQVARLESYGSVPLVGRGVRIVHARPDYPAKIIFWSFRDPDRVVDDIRLLGFIPQASSAIVPTRSSMPLRWSAVIMFIVVWNLLFVLDGFVPWKEPKVPGLFHQLALGLAFSVAVVTQRSKTMQYWVLRPGRSVGEIRSFLLLLQIVSGFLLVVSTLFRLLEPPAG